MYSEEEDDIMKSEKLPIYLKGKEIFDMENKITALIPENDACLNEFKFCMLSDAALLTLSSFDNYIRLWGFYSGCCIFDLTEDRQN